MNPSEILKAAKALIDSPEKWTQDALARIESGCATSSSDPRAVCFCTLGALYKAAGRNHELVSNKLVTVMGKNNLSQFNDTHTHTEVMQAWDKAIMLAELEEAK